RGWRRYTLPHGPRRLPGELRSPAQRPRRHHPARGRHLRRPDRRRPQEPLEGRRAVHHRGAPRDHPRGDRRHAHRQRRGVRRAARRLRQEDRRQGDRQGPAGDLGLRVRAADGPPEQAAEPQRRDDVHHDRDALVLRLEHAHQGDRPVRRRRLEARPAGDAAEAQGALRAGGGLMGELFRGMAANDGIRVVAVDTTDVVREAMVRQGASATAGAATGRAMTAAVLLSHVLLKSPRDRVTLRLDGGGPLGRVTAEAGLDHAVRGYAQNPSVELPLRPDGKLDVGRAVGTDGEIRVVRSHAPYGDPYTSSIALTSGEVAEDVATYLAVSE